MVVDGDGQLFLGLILPDDVGVEEGLDFGRTRQPPIDGAGLFALLFFENLLADAHALIAYVGARVVGRRTDQFFDLLLRFVAERAAQRFVGIKFSHRIIGLMQLAFAAQQPQNVLSIFYGCFLLHVAAYRRLLLTVWCASSGACG